MKKLSLLLLFFVVIFTGCSKDSEEHGAGHTNVPVMIDVEIQIPDNVKAGEEVMLTALVTQGDEKVEDASEVVFEVRASGQDKGEMIKASHEGDGVYSVKSTFENEATYIVVAHVTARDMHNMPSKEVVVTK
ncbi:FixH family protein [Bacillus suaedaesalsae]|uniref:FixH family protein n=1 Tax=Bacillus suaedaesalsae TaxID=2810349 RepID=A0ABS2DI36_9BACI|nr:FixH family protein [Bacillus suaedaesalsae]MBM6618157.1 FixH family protein [Bacillus suaedaesalsae]